MFFGGFDFLIWPFLIVGLVVYRFMRRKSGKAVTPGKDKDWYLQFAFSKEDAVSQLYFLLSVAFFGVTLLTVSREFDNILSWQSVLFVTSLFGIVSAYYFRVLYTLPLSLMGFIVWWGAKAAEWIAEKGVAASAVVAGLFFLSLIFYFVGRLHEKEMKFKRFALVYIVLGMIAITGHLFIFSTKPGLEFFASITKGEIFFSSWQLTLSLLILAMVVVGTIVVATSRKLMSFSETTVFSLLFLLFGVIAILPPQELFIAGRGYANTLWYGGRELSAMGVLWAVVFNLIVFFELIGLILLGYLRREEWMINMGAFFLFLLIAIKYFDWFFTFLDKSIFFIGAGILLFGLGWSMERGRRYMIANIQEEGGHSV